MTTKKKNIEADILKMAERLFVKQGYAETSTVQIAAKLGINQALIYYYHGSKEELLKRVLQGRMQRAFSKLEKVLLDEKTTAEEALKELLHQHFRLCRVNADFVRFVANCLAQQPKIGTFVRESLGAMVKGKVIELLQRGEREGVFRRVDYDLLVTTIFSLNITPFLLNPIVKVVTAEQYPDYEMFLKEREAENIRIMMSLVKM